MTGQPPIVIAALGPFEPFRETPGRWRVDTVNSAYELERNEAGEWRVRRLRGRHDPTPRTGTDGVWKDADDVLERPGQGLLIVWAGTQGTYTSNVQGVVALDEEVPA